MIFTLAVYFMMLWLLAMIIWIAGNYPVRLAKVFYKRS